MSNKLSKMNWTPETVADLIGCILSESPPSTDQLRVVAQKMNDLGYPCTLKAITHQVAKLKQVRGFHENASSAASPSFLSKGNKGATTTGTKKPRASMPTTMTSSPGADSPLSKHSKAKTAPRMKTTAAAVFMPSSPPSPTPMGMSKKRGRILDDDSVDDNLLPGEKRARVDPVPSNHEPAWYEPYSDLVDGQGFGYDDTADVKAEMKEEQPDDDGLI